MNLFRPFVSKDEHLGPGPRELIAIAALCTRGEVELAAQHIRRAYDYGMTKRQVLEAIACVLPMSGMVTGQLGWRAMRLADKLKGKNRTAKPAKKRKR